MKIRNNTNNKIVIYVGNPMDEEPEFTAELKIGEDVDLPENAGELISLQEK